ncbi:TIGR03032 family protein [Nostoc sp. FACHB-145]|uniref:TIGR03032 family protein n=1 Tax=Nostoc sp. FACHB-145 TaxID=2692836 RepID=UPI001688B9DC|nr:TIGR03032 family protein [Nostoc sp. FACHB-145]MBD2472968.1 TIGR03032 family protein [Nostoc sp. FACHB-145]
MPDQPIQQVIQGNASDSFQACMSQIGGAIAFTTYQANKLMLVGWNGQQMTLLMRHFLKPMGLGVSKDGLALATQETVWLFANAPHLAHTYLEDQPGAYDRLYLPRTVYLTGDLNTHDLSFAQEELWLVNTRFSCLSTLSHTFNFIPRWQPSFISQLAPEDRCHLNGLAIVKGQPKYVTALGESDTVGGWRANKATGGILIDVERNEILLRGLSMPHSPVWYQDYLWFLNSGTGELWRVEPESLEYHLVCTLPGFLRGLAFAGNYALIGLCQIRERHIFGDLPIQRKFEQLKCGVAIVDLQTGQTTGLLEFTTGCREIYAVQFLPEVLCPNLLNPEHPSVKQAFTAPGIDYWLRSSTEIKDSST